MLKCRILLTKKAQDLKPSQNIQTIDFLKTYYLFFHPKTEKVT